MSSPDDLCFGRGEGLNAAYRINPDGHPYGSFHSCVSEVETSRVSARAFDDDTERAILAARAVGVPTKDIVAEYGHRNAVYSLFRRAGVDLRPSGPTERLISPSEERQILALNATGVSSSIIAQRVGRSRGLVEGLIARSQQGES